MTTETTAAIPLEVQIASAQKHYSMALSDLEAARAACKKLGTELVELRKQQLKELKASAKALLK